ncbi:TPA: hypothetical protein ACG3P3_001516 [Clostridioides difficile]
MENLLEEALLEEYKLWEKGNEKRIYINKIPELINIEKLIENNDFGIGKGKGLGISKIARLLNNDRDISIAKLYYDCTYEEFIFQETNSETVNNFIKLLTNELILRYSPKKEEAVEDDEKNETNKEIYEICTKTFFDEMSDDTELLLEKTNEYLRCYNKRYYEINYMLEDINKAKINLDEFCTHYQLRDSRMYYFYKLSKYDLIRLHEATKEILERLRTEEEKKNENKNKEIEKLFEKAKTTGEKQFIEAVIIKCDDYMESYCDFMEVARYAMPTGNIKVEKTAIPID